jgi:hypothetical protein
MAAGATGGRQKAVIIAAIVVVAAAALGAGGYGLWRAREARDAFRALKLTPLPVAPDGKAKISFRAVKQTGCGAGDYDAIELDLANGNAGPPGGPVPPQRQLLLTIERLSGKRPVLSMQVGLDQVDRGISSAVAAGGLADGTLLGIFLCASTAGDASCRGKQAYDINRIFQALAGGRVEDMKFFGLPKIYAFSLLVAWGGRLFTPPDPRQELGWYERLATASGDPGGARHAADLNNTLLSLPLTAEQDATLMKVPRHDRDCEKGIDFSPP